MTDPANVQIDSLISLQPWDLELLQHVARQRGLSTNDIDTALGLIIREWLEMQEELPGAAFPVSSMVE